MSTTTLKPEERQALRRETLKFLADRQALSFTAEDILNRFLDSRKFDFTPTTDDVTTALRFIHSSGWADEIPSTTGAAIFFRATSDGVLAYEQGRI